MAEEELARPKIAVFRECRNEIESMIRSGYKSPAILAWLEKEKGLVLDVGTWKSYVRREGLIAKNISHEKPSFVKKAIKEVAPVIVNKPDADTREIKRVESKADLVAIRNGVEGLDFSNLSVDDIRD